MQLLNLVHHTEGNCEQGSGGGGGGSYRRMEKTS